jgi:hypothetical protein
MISDPIHCQNPIIFHAKDSEVPGIKQIHFPQRRQKQSLHDDFSMSPRVQGVGNRPFSEHPKTFSNVVIGQSHNLSSLGIGSHQMPFFSA